MFGTATLSFADGIRTLLGDELEIEAIEFGMPLRNTLAVDSSVAANWRVAVRAL